MSNKRAKERLIKLFGVQCFIDKLHLRKKDKDKKRGKKFKGSKKRRKILQNLTYHHIIERHLGGRATVENGALLSKENHEWFHKQPVSDQINMDRKFQEYKVNVLKQKGILNQFQEEFAVPKESLYNKSKKSEFKENLRIDNIDGRLPQKFNRAKRKENDRKIFSEYLER